MGCYILKRLTYLLSVLFICLTLGGCVWLAAGAAVVGVTGIVIVGGSVSEIDDKEIALAVEKGIYAIEKEGGNVTDMSFADGYVKGIIDDYNITINIHPVEDGLVDVSVRVSKNLIPNTSLAEKIMTNYREFKR